MTKPDPTLAQIAAQFTRHDVEKTGGAYMILDRRTASPVARLRPIPNTDRFELFYWSNVKGRWTTFGNLGRMKLMLESAQEIVENDPIFRIPRTRRAEDDLEKRPVAIYQRQKSPMSPSMPLGKSSTSACRENPRGLSCSNQTS